MFPKPVSKYGDKLKLFLGSLTSFSRHSHGCYVLENEFIKQCTVYIYGMYNVVGSLRTLHIENSFSFLSDIFLILTYELLFVAAQVAFNIRHPLWDLFREYTLVNIRSSLYFADYS